MSSPRYLLRFKSRISHLSVALSHHNVVGSENRDCIGDHITSGHMVECAHVNKRGGTYLQAIGFPAARTHNIESQFPFVRFGPAIDLTWRSIKALREELKLLDHGLQVRKNPLLRWQSDAGHIR